jgi:hypothetical protein
MVIAIKIFIVKLIQFPLLPFRFVLYTCTHLLINDYLPTGHGGTFPFDSNYKLNGAESFAMSRGEINPKFTVDKPVTLCE